MSTRRARRRLDPKDRRNELLEAAERVIRRKGKDVRIDDIVAEAKAAKGTFYLYFASWEDLLLELRSRAFAEFERQYPETTELPKRRDDWGPYIERLANAFVDFTIALGGLHEAIFHGAMASSPRTESPFDALKLVTAVLKAGTNTGALTVVDSEATARLVFAVMHETVDAICAGRDRKRALAAMNAFLRRALIVRSRAA